MASINPADQFAVLRTSKLAAYLGGVLLAIIGLIVLFWPKGTIKVVAVVVGVGLVIAGLAHVIEAMGSRSVRPYWGLLLARGLIDIAVGLVAIFWPSITVWALVLLFGVELLLTGVLSMVLAFQASTEEGRTVYVVRALFSVLAGLVVLAWPSATVWVLVVLVGAYFIGAGLLLLWIGFQLGKTEHDAVPA